MLAIETVLRTGRYDAASIDPVVPEWPPHPARLFNALVASAESEDDFAALEALERLAPPTVHASSAADTAEIVERGYVVANAVESGGGGNLTWPGRTNGLRLRTGVSVREPTFALTWPDAALPSDAVDRLVGLAARVPYVGRVTSEAVVRVADALPDRERWVRYEPVGLDQPGTMLRVPYPGYLAELRDAFRDGRRAHEVSHSIPYQVVRDDDDVLPLEMAEGPFSDLLVFGFRQGASISGDRLVQVTSMLRKAVLDRIKVDVPPAVSGHGAQQEDHVAYLGLPNVGYKRSDGHLLGVALALPRTMAREHRRLLLAKMLIPEMRELTIDRSTVAGVTYDPARTSPWGLLSERWMRPQGVKSWVTATPLMLDRFPKRRDNPAQLVADAVVRAGYPEPDVEISPAPLAIGAMHRPRPGTLPENRPRRPLFHARLTFSEPVRGPVLAGSMRYLGLGLFIPTPATADS